MGVFDGFKRRKYWSDVNAYADAHGVRSGEAPATAARTVKPSMTSALGALLGANPLGRTVEQVVERVERSGSNDDVLLPVTQSDLGLMNPIDVALPEVIGLIHDLTPYAVLQVDSANGGQAAYLRIRKTEGATKEPPVLPPALGGPTSPDRGRVTARPFWFDAPEVPDDVDWASSRTSGLLTDGRWREGIALAWQIWQTRGLHEGDAFDHLTRGFKLWRESGEFSAEQGGQFLEDMLSRLRNSPSVPWQNLAEAAYDQINPLATYYGARCWAANELLEVLSTEAATERASDVFQTISSCRYEFVPYRSLYWARQYATNHRLPDPWPNWS